MSNKKQKSASAKVVEWIGAIILLKSAPEFDVGASPNEGVLWMDADGVVAGFHVGKAGEIMALLGNSLEQAIASAGQKRSALPPQRLRVNAPRLAEALRSLDTGIEIVCAPTPEVGKVMDAMLKLIELETRGKASESKVRAKDAAADLQQYVMRAAELLHRADPLAAVPDHRLAITVTVDKLGLRDGLLSIYAPPIAIEEECWTVTLLPGRDDFDAMIAYREEAERDIEKMHAPDFDMVAWQDKQQEMPPNLSVTFFPGEESLADDQADDEEWEPRPSGAHLDFVVLKKGEAGRHPTNDEATLAGVILLTLSEFLKNRERLKAAWQGGSRYSQTFPVELYGKTVEVVLSVVEGAQTFI